MLSRYIGASSSVHIVHSRCCADEPMQRCWIRRAWDMSCENACFAILQRLCIHKPIGRVNTAATVNPTSGHNFGTGTMAGIQAECKG